LTRSFSRFAVGTPYDEVGCGVNGVASKGP
jgi:hypothetical protein